MGSFEGSAMASKMRRIEISLLVELVQFDAFGGICRRMNVPNGNGSECGVTYVELLSLRAQAQQIDVCAVDG